MTELEFKEALSEKGISLSDAQMAQFNRYYEVLVEWNEKMNLTAITEKEEVYLKHFYDSITIAFDFPFESQSIVDIGAGAGFPSIPLKIAFPSLQVTIVDSLNKRITFLHHLFEELHLDHCQAVAARAEEYVKEHRESYDVAMARAVARLNILDELCMPYVKVGGHFLALKGRQGQDELKEAKKGITTLGGKVVKCASFDLSDENDHRENIIIKKEKKTPAKYPRMFSKIKKQPL